jgi:hypothetical protein
MRIRRLALAVVAMLTAAPLAAQRVRGVVRDSASAQPVSGAVVALLDSAGRTAARTISDERGRFFVEGVGGRRVRIIRIGFQPRDVPLAGTPAAGEYTIDVTMLHIVALPSVRVASQALCPGAIDRAGALTLWEQARAGLLAAVVAREARPAAVNVLHYERAMDGQSELVRSQLATPRSGVTTRPFVAVTNAATFATIGYVTDDPSGRLYNAPDADVLLDPSFAATHCFRIVPGDAGRMDQVGLGFGPLPTRDTIADVSGVLWMDRTVPALRSLEFRYTALEPAAMSAGAGGELTFRTMTNGVILIERWKLRMPLLAQIAASKNRLEMRIGANDWIRRRDRRDVVVTELRETGGEVLRASWARSNGPTWEAALPRVTGRVTEERTGKGAAGVLVWLAGTNDSTITDSTGAYVLAHLLPGRYEVRASDTTLAVFRRPQTRARTIDVVRGADATASLAITPRDETYADLCRDERVGPDDLIVVGRVLGADGQPVRDVSLQVRWQAEFNVTSAGGVAVRTAERSPDIDEAGRFRVCGVARERPITFTALRGKAVVADTAVKFYSRGAGDVVTIRIP